MSVVYKTLFDLKILHEYYLTDSDGNSIFDLLTQADRKAYLIEEYARGHDSISKDLAFVFPKSLMELYGGLGLVLLPSYSGCKVVARVKPSKLSDNSEVYAPFQTLPENIFIQILRRNGSFNEYTQFSFKDGISGNYLFSNENINGDKAFPNLTNEISLFNAAGRYEQGELSSFGPTDIREFYFDGTTEQWEPVSGNAFANANDQLLVPRRFSFSIGAEGLTEADIVINDPDGNEVRTFNVTNARTVHIDLSDQPDIFLSPETGSFHDRLYTLEVTGPGSFFESRKLAISDNLFDRSALGLIHINTIPTNTAFNLLDTDGFIIKRKDPLGVTSDAPLFEIPFKGRSAFWRYGNDKGRKIQPQPDHLGYLEPEGRFLLSHRPLPITKYHFIIQKQGSSDTKYFPNPVNYSLKRDDKNRFCFDILVPKSKLFPV